MAQNWAAEGTFCSLMGTSSGIGVPGAADVSNRTPSPPTELANINVLAFRFAASSQKQLIQTRRPLTAVSGEAMSVMPREQTFAESPNSRHRQPTASSARYPKPAIRSSRVDTRFSAVSGDL